MANIHQKGLNMLKRIINNSFIIIILLTIMSCSINESSTTTSESKNSQNQDKTIEPLNTKNIENSNNIISSNKTGIWVHGESTINVDPDILKLNIGIETEDKTTQIALNKSSIYMDKIIQYFKSINIDDNDIQTTNFSIYPIYEYPEIITPGKNTRTQTLVGYRVNNSISVKIRNIESTGTVIDEVTNVGENSIRINNISFDRENTDEFINELRKQAVENASFKAKQYASFAQVELGKLVFLSEPSISTTISNTEMYGMRSMASPSLMSTPIKEGELEFNLTIEAGYQIID
ncbi:MAG: hypothetical protein CL766_05335 [Chloroflexi bacterium]|nr:hypothetical protein [Chloroflexota bacterium]|tara:strand:+ start:25410 stop:26282 length:873 start_codon:yes stop_codon:yes gene_type:complete